MYMNEQPRKALPVIGEQEKFYGYIVGVGVETDKGMDKEKYCGMYAAFEYNGEVTIWSVPDPDLFEILSSHLVGMAKIRWDTTGDDYGYSKLWISKKGEKWDVDLP
jgi:hypothetical protein